MTDIGIYLGTDEITESARDAERLGFESVWVWDHFTGRYPAMLAPEVVLATAAAVTERVRVGYGVLLAAVRPLPLLAKELASLQYVSRGRLLVGVGDGRGAWERWHGGLRDAPVWDALGVRRTTAEARTEEALRLLPRLVGGEPTRITPDGVGDGVEITLAPAVSAPPLFVAGGPEEAVLRRAVAFGAGWFPAVISPAQLADGVRRLRRYAEEAGRPVPPVTVAVPVQLDVPAGEVADARDALVRMVVEAYGVDPGQAAGVGIVGTPEQAAERLAAFVAAGADRIVLSGGSAGDWRTGHELLARTAALLSG
ncbi:LLM class flavin-dependent oxidoreductase [Streptomyces sp. NPDC057307]|uniref:LLM class flavin-dependent oxidoreductase n=1 Tax=Streptomyces sp. NPDC057307 TaxID=3346096 RepID=UPI003634C3E7